tara:strand:+ start:6654 stop:6974 length:321 start_codon:yes stop_codon:yes gene_type:complete
MGFLPDRFSVARPLGVEDMTASRCWRLDLAGTILSGNCPAGLLLLRVQHLLYIIRENKCILMDDPVDDFHAVDPKGEVLAGTQIVSKLARGGEFHVLTPDYQKLRR